VIFAGQFNNFSKQKHRPAWHCRFPDWQWHLTKPCLLKIDKFATASSKDTSLSFFYLLNHYFKIVEVPLWNTNFLLYQLLCQLGKRRMSITNPFIFWLLRGPWSTFWTLNTIWSPNGQVLLNVNIKQKSGNFKCQCFCYKKKLNVPANATKH